MIKKKKKSNKQELNLPERNVPAEVETLFEDICFANVCGKIPFYFYNLTETDKKKVTVMFQFSLNFNITYNCELV